MISGKSIALATLLLFLAPAVFAQKTKAQLEKEKQEQLEKIKDVERIIDETVSKKKNSLGELNALSQRIQDQLGLIAVVKGEADLLDNDISENQDIISSLQRDLTQLKQEYAQMLFVAQKANNSATRLTFLFSADSFNQFMMRLQYMHQYGETRKQQIVEITRVQQTLTDKVNDLQKQLDEKNKLLAEGIAENKNLENLKSRQTSLVHTLETQEKKLRSDLENTKKAVAELDKLIDKIIKEEIERSRNAKSENNTALSSSFEENKSKFNWPVTGFVSQHFGRQKHPVLKGVILQNDGINIQTKENEKVHCIFNGEVRAVAFIPTLGSSVIIKHGEYLTVYAGLKDVYVKMGQKVVTNQEIGTVLSNGEGAPELRFQIRKNTTPLDPQDWLRKL